VRSSTNEVGAGALGRGGKDGMQQRRRGHVGHARLTVVRTVDDHVMVAAGWAPDVKTAKARVVRAEVDLGVHGNARDQETSLGGLPWVCTGSVGTVRTAHKYTTCPELRQAAALVLNEQVMELENAEVSVKVLRWRGEVKKARRVLSRHKLCTEPGHGRDLLAVSAKLLLVHAGVEDKHVGGGEDGRAAPERRQVRAKRQGGGNVIFKITADTAFDFLLKPLDDVGFLADEPSMCRDEMNLTASAQENRSRVKARVVSHFDAAVSTRETGRKGYVNTRLSSDPARLSLHAHFTSMGCRGMATRSTPRAGL